MFPMDDQQFTGLVRRHAGLLHKVAFAYCKSAADREDVIQEITMQLWRARQRYDESFKETTWIYRVAINVAISFYRRESRHRKGRQPYDASAITVSEPSAEPSEELQVLLRCIDGLNALEKGLVLLYLDGNDHPSIAHVLGISVSNVGTKLMRIKDKLRAAFERPPHPQDPLHSQETEKPNGTR